MKNNIKYTLLTPALVLALAACQDNWDEHYDQYPDTTFGNSSLYEAIKSESDLSDFCKVIDATRMFANSKMTVTTYKELLNSDQVFTVWAPKNGTFNVDSLLEMCKTQNGDSLVESQFLMNHIARYSHADNGKKQTITTLNSKYLKVDNLVAGNANLVSGKYNMTAANGVLHTIDEPIAFQYNLYEKLINLDKYSHIGKFFRSYHINRFDESSSLATGANDEGKTVYIDSVFYTYNSLWSSYAPINLEDSSYLIVMPTKEVWDSIYKEAKPYYDYSSYSSDSVKNDSVSEYNVHYGLLNDFLFNANPWIQKYKDVAFSIRYNLDDLLLEDEIYHVYWNPYEEGGIFNLPGTVTDTCSNGIIYNVTSWPFPKDYTYTKTIKVEAEERRGYRSYLYDKGGNPKKTKELACSSISTTADSISHGYLSMTASVASDKYWVEYEIPGVLSGAYDIYAVLLPKTVDENMDMTFPGNKLPNKFTAEITYTGRDQQVYTIDSKTRGVLDESKPSNYDFNSNADYIMECNLDPTKTTRTFTNKPMQVDTVKLCTFKFPTCNFGQTNITNRIRINNAMESKDARTANANIFLDCIILKPHEDK